jgi:hypothetical protein
MHVGVLWHSLCLMSGNSHQLNLCDVYDDLQRVAVNHQCDHFGVGDITGCCSSNVAHLTVNGLVVKNTLF